MSIDHAPHYGIAQRKRHAGPVQVALMEELRPGCIPRLIHLAEILHEGGMPLKGAIEVAAGMSSVPIEWPDGLWMKPLGGAL